MWTRSKRMSTWVPIEYREFWDIPRVFIARYKGKTILFDCVFDECTEDFPDSYTAYLLPSLEDRDLAGSWDKLSALAIQSLGTVSVSSVRFDASKRREVDGAILDELLAAKIAG